MLPLRSILDRKYDLQEKIGEGAMGTVFRATHVVTHQELAVKVLSARRATETAKARFLREVRLAGALRHPNVVRVVDAGEDAESETLYIVMEHLVGRDLEAVFGGGELSRSEGLELVLQVLPALAQAHDAGIVHRDLKPENLFLCTDGTVKLLDFGVARELGGSKVTATGTSMGTPVYMSPEQGLRPKEVDHRSDLWSVGVILYELVAGFPPFVDESPHAVVFKANAEAHAPLGEVVADTPRALSALVDRCLAKDMAGRPADARAIAAILEGVLADDRAAAFLSAPIDFGANEAGPSSAPVPLHSSAPPSRNTETLPVAAEGRARAWVALVALAAVALVGWLGWSLSRPEQGAPPAVATPTPEPETEDEREAENEAERERMPTPGPVPIAPVAPETEDEREAEDEAETPRLARRSSPRREARRTEPSREDPAPSAPTRTDPEPASMATAEPEPEATPMAEPEPAETPMAPEPRPVVTPSERSETTRARPSRRTRRAQRPAEPAEEPEPPPLTF